jgi:hypothetical protein
MGLQIRVRLVGMAAPMIDFGVVVARRSHFLTKVLVQGK